MFTLLHGFYKYLVQKDEYCVLILGLDDAGKTVSRQRNRTLATSPSLIEIVFASADVFGGGQNEIVQKLHWNESEIHHNNSWTEYWTN